jgi:DNA-binding CsgD family transcriptional regulator
MEKYRGQAMNGDGNHSTSNGAGSGKQLMLTATRIKHLLANLASLQSDRRLLLDSMRGSLEELRSLRASFEQRRAREGANGSVDGRGQPLLDHLQQHHKLTQRESEVAILLAQGASNLAIASILSISPHTARHHTQAVLSKLGARSRSEAGAKLRG